MQQGTLFSLSHQIKTFNYEPLTLRPEQKATLIFSKFLQHIENYNRFWIVFQNQLAYLYYNFKYAKKPTYR